MSIQEWVQLTQADDEVVTVLICPIQQQHLNDFNSIWKPMLETLNGEDAFWNWVRKQRLALSDDRYEAYAIEQDDLTQGLLWLETQWHHSRWKQDSPFYVAALASAPWNRHLLNPQPWLSGVGSALLSFTRQRSLDLGYGGRLGLHALPGSESFYESCNMLNLGYDPDQEMSYFEYGLLSPAPREEDGARTNPDRQSGAASGNAGRSCAGLRYPDWRQNARTEAH